MADRLSPERADRRERLIFAYRLRFRLNLRGRRWASRFVARRGWR